MPLVSITCPRAVRRPPKSAATDHDRFDRAVELFRAGEHLAAAEETIAFALGVDARPSLKEAPLTFEQGSARVTVKVDGDTFVVEVPLVRLTGAENPTAALRYLLSRVSGSGQLHQPRLSGDDVVLEFHDRLSRLHPVKVLEVLRRIPVEADNTDDWLIDQFGVAPYDRVDIEPLSAEEVLQAREIWAVHWRQIDELVKEAQRKRSMFFLNEVTAFAIHQVRYALPITGALFARVAESANVFNDTEEDPQKRETVLAKCIREMTALTPEELERNLGHARYAITPQSEGKPEVVVNCLANEEYMNSVQRLRTSGRHMEAAVAMIGSYTYMLARFSWPPSLDAELTGALESVSGRPFREAANTLWAHAKELVTAAKARLDAPDDGEPEVGATTEDAGASGADAGGAPS